MNKNIINLLSWYQIHRRNLPWRQSANPYHIWLSEVILQQTRVDQGLPYYVRFAERFPNIRLLAKADQQEVYKLWQGLGYYSRADNMLKAAREVVQTYDGQFPADLNLLKSLPGIGPYTAAAIASMAFGLPHAVVDGNVYRVLARAYGVDTPINTTNAHRQFQQLAESLMPPDEAANFNQAMMELGALVCKPAHPECDSCPLSDMCFAFNNHQIDRFPVKNPKTRQKEVFLNYFVINTLKSGQPHTFIYKRPKGDIWAHLYDFPFVQTEAPISPEKAISEAVNRGWLDPASLVINHVSPDYKHLLTHRKIFARFISVTISPPISDILKNTLLLVEQTSLTDYPVSVLTERYLREGLLKKKS